MQGAEVNIPTQLMQKEKKKKKKKKEEDGWYLMRSATLLVGLTRPWGLPNLGTPLHGPNQSST